MLQADTPDTFILATGRTERIRDFVEMTCKALDIGIAWEGVGGDEVGIDQKKQAIPLLKSTRSFTGRLKWIS